MTADIKTVTTKIRQKGTGKEFVGSYTELNGSGGETSRREFDENGSLILQSVTCYNEQNRKCVQNAFDAGGLLLYKTKYFYKQNGKIGNEETTFAGGEVLLKTYFYKDNTLMVRTINDEDEEKERLVYVYDEKNGRVLTESEFGRGFQGKEFRRTEFVYDEVSERLTQKIITDLRTGTASVTRFSYDALGRIVSEEDENIVRTYEYNF